MHHTRYAEVSYTSVIWTFIFDPHVSYTGHYASTSPWAVKFFNSNQQQCHHFRNWRNSTNFWSNNLICASSCTTKPTYLTITFTMVTSNQTYHGVPPFCQMHLAVLENVHSFSSLDLFLLRLPHLLLIMLPGLFSCSSLCYALLSRSILFPSEVVQDYLTQYLTFPALSFSLFSHKLPRLPPAHIHSFL